MTTFEEISVVFLITIIGVSLFIFILKLFDRKNNKPKYEVACLRVHENHVDERLEVLQNEGWEIAGDILIKNQSGHCTDTYFNIPLKRVKTK